MRKYVINSDINNDKTNAIESKRWHRIQNTAQISNTETQRDKRLIF